MNTWFMQLEFITGVMLGLEFRKGFVVFDLLIVRLIVGVINE